MIRKLTIAAIMLMIIMASASTAAETASIIWRYKIQANCIAVSVDGAVVVGAGKEVIAIDSNGRKAWSWDAQSVVEHLEFGPQGEVFASSGTQLAKLGRDGSLAWALEANEKIYSIMPTPDGSIIAGTGYGTQAFSGEGELLWEHYPENQTIPSFDCST